MKLIRLKFNKNRRLRKASSYIRKIYWSIILLCSTFFIGTIGYVLIENYTFIEALYMTVITVSTVGFTEVHPLTDAGRIFTSLLIIFNIGTFAYAVSTISTFIVEGEFSKLMNEYRTMDKIDKLEDHVIVCGYGRYGEETSSELIKADIPFLIIENNKEKVDTLQNNTDYLVLEGDATADETLVRAGIMKAKAIIITIADIAENAYVCLTARQESSQVRIVSRAQDLKTQAKLKKAGADFVILPERLGGIHMVNLVKNPGVIEFMSFLSEKGISFEEIPCIHLKKEFLFKTLAQLQIGKNTGAHIIGIRHNDNDCIVNPGGHFVIEKDMNLICIGDKTQLDNIKKLILDPTYLDMV